MYVISFRWRGLYRGGLLRRMLNETSVKVKTTTPNPGQRECREDKSPSAPSQPPRKPGDSQGTLPSQN